MLKSFLLNQVKENKTFVDMLLNEVTEEYLYKKSAHSDANIAWQFGHLCIANYAQFVSFTKQSNNFPSEKELVTLMEWCKGLGDTHRFLPEDIMGKDVLLKLYNTIYEVCLSAIENISESDFDSKIPTEPFPHPHAETVVEIIGYGIRHEMWHCAEIEALKREFQLNHVFVSK